MNSILQEKKEEWKYIFEYYGFYQISNLNIALQTRDSLLKELDYE